MNKNLLMFLIIFLGSFCQASSDADAVDLKYYHPTLVNIVKRIRNNYPPEEYIYVGVGRSPGLVLMYLNHLGDQAYGLPASRLSMLEEQDRLALEGKFKIHFDKYVPRSLKKLLLIDFSDSGRSFLNAALMVKGALNGSRGFSLFSLVGYEEADEVKTLFSKYPEFNFEAYVLSGSNFFYRALHDSRVEHFSPYGFFNLRDDSVPLNEEFQKMRSIVEAYLDKQQGFSFSFRQCKSFL